MPGMKVTYKRASRRSDPAQKVLALQRLALETAQKVQGLYQQTVDNWQPEDQPDFVIQEVSAGDDLTFNVAADIGNESVFRYVDEGTRKRYAVMTDPFAAKTQVGVIGSGAGMGGFSHFDFRNPKAGIKARNFGRAIVEQLQEGFVAEARRIVRG